MLYKIILFLNIISLAIVIYVLASYVRDMRRRNEHKNQDDAMQ
ncbi:hypothetical protein [Flagellimonas marina]|uniref:Uncharacterized protein n=1 Tax=Flagellimonas marina TaxID=1775168 RepID=A0ABV8PNQ4_9FLAO